jgi:hypothetical protein
MDTTRLIIILIVVLTLFCWWRLVRAATLVLEVKGQHKNWRSIGFS